MGVRQALLRALRAVARAPGPARLDLRLSGLRRLASGVRRHASLRGFKADLFDWTRDYEAVIDAPRPRDPTARSICWATAWARSCRAFWSSLSKVDGLISIAAGQRLLARERARASSAACCTSGSSWSRLPRGCAATSRARKLRKVGDLPRGVILQWRRWCLDPRYSAGRAKARPRTRATRGCASRCWRCRSPTTNSMTLRGTHSLLESSMRARRARCSASRTDRRARASASGTSASSASNSSQTLWPRIAESLHQLPHVCADTGATLDVEAHAARRRVPGHRQSFAGRSPGQGPFITRSEALRPALRRALSAQPALPDQHAAADAQRDRPAMRPDRLDASTSRAVFDAMWVERATSTIQPRRSTPFCGRRLDPPACSRSPTTRGQGAAQGRAHKRLLRAACSARRPCSSATTMYWGQDRLDFVREALA